MAAEDIDIFNQDHMTIEAYDPEGNLTERKIIFSASQESDPLVSEAREKFDALNAPSTFNFSQEKPVRMVDPVGGSVVEVPADFEVVKSYMDAGYQLELPPLGGGMGGPVGGIRPKRGFKGKYPSAYQSKRAAAQAAAKAAAMQQGLGSQADLMKGAMSQREFDQFNKFSKGGDVNDFDIFDYLPSEAQVAYFGSQFAPGMGLVDASGELPAMPAGDVELIDAFAAEDLPGMGENIERGEYFDAAMQALGLLGDAMYMVPVAGAVTGPTLGTVSKGLGIAGKAAKRGIQSLDFSVDDLKKVFISDHPPVGAVDVQTSKKGDIRTVTEKIIRDRANTYEKTLKQKGATGAAVRRRDSARAANKIEDLVPQERIILDPNELYGYSLVPVQGDRSGIGTLTDIKGVPLSFPVQVQGGPGYPQFMGKGYGWASNYGAASTKQSNIAKALEETGLPPLGVFTGMAREGINFSTPVVLSMVGQLDYLKIPKKHIESFNKTVRKGTKKQEGIKDFVGLDSPDLIPQLLGEIPSSSSAGDIRKAVIAEMSKPSRRDQGFPIYEDVLQTITNPDLRIPPNIPGAANPAETGYTIFKGKPEASVFKDPSHLSYDTVIPGDYMGGLIGRGVPPELMFPQNFADMSKALTKPKNPKLKPRPFTRSEMIGAMGKRQMVEPVTDKLIEDLAQYLNRVYGTKYAQGGIVSLTGVAA